MTTISIDFASITNDPLIPHLKATQTAGLLRTNKCYVDKVENKDRFLIILQSK